MTLKNSRLIEVCVVVLISTFIGMICGYSYFYLGNKKVSYKISDIDEINEMYNKILNEYYSEIDKTELINGALSGMMSVLDNYTSFMDEDKTSTFKNKMKGEYFGVGIEGLTLNDEGILVVDVLKDSPAYNLDIKSGDIIVSVNNESMINKTASYFNEITSKDVEMKLKILRNNKYLNISVIPEKIIIKSVISNKYEIDKKRIGYLKITVFASNTANQFTNELKKLEQSGIDSLIIDVRNNNGGYLSSVSTILELFMKKGSILYKLDNKSDVQNRLDTTDESRNYEVVVLTNSSSASASEILAACFFENYNSDIVGVKTYGKGTVQETINLSDNTMAKVTTKKWLTPNGNWINQVGVNPTIQVNLNDDYLSYPSFENDNQLNVAINILLK